MRAIAAALIGYACWTTAALGGDEGLTVVGNGEARGKPTAVEFYTRIGGAGELGADALTKFREFKRRTKLALDKQRFSEGDVQMAGFSFTSQNGSGDQNFLAFRMMEAEPPMGKPTVTFSSLARITLRGIDRLSEEEVLDTVSELSDRLADSGVTIQPVQTNTDANEFEVQDGFGNPPLAIFVLEDASELRELARERAFEAAQQSAERLARLAGAKLGPVLAIHENSGEPEQFVDAFGNAAPRLGRRAKLRLTSSTLSELPVRVSLEVRFALRQQEIAPARDQKQEQTR